MLEQSRPASYPNAMPTTLRRLVALLILTAYMSAATFPLVPAAHAMSGDMGTSMAHHQDNPNDRMPCKSTPQPCVADLGCMFLVSLPAVSDPTLLTLAAWASVQYPGSPQTMHGLSVKPALGPPISRT